MNKEIFFKGMEWLCKSFQLAPSTDTMEAWKTALDDIDDAAFIYGVRSILENYTHLPDRNFNLGAMIKKEVSKYLALTPEEAWGEVKKAISRVGFYGVPQFNDSAITSAVDVLGWKDICCTPTASEGVLRAHFLRIYEACRNRQVIKKTKSMLPAPIQALLKGLAEEGQPGRIPLLPEKGED